LATQKSAVTEILQYVSHRIYLTSFRNGLKPAQWIALRYFADVNVNAATLTAYAAQIGSTKGTASRTIGHLIRQGYLEYVVNEADRRSKLIKVTGAGQTMLDNDPLLDLDGLIRQLDQRETKTLQEVLLKILHSKTIVDPSA